jgi:hypothetical protein
MRIFLFLILVVLIITPSRLCSQVSDKGYLEIVNNFFALIQNDKYGEAVDLMNSTNPWMKAKSDEIAKVRSGMADLPSLAGSILSHEVLSEASIGPGFIHLDYIVNFERQPLRFYFDFHKVRDRWNTFSFGYKDDLKDWASEKAKLNYLNNRVKE